jgi:hypothetical protein
MEHPLSCAERLMRTIRWEPADRVPIEPPIPLNPLQWAEAPPTQGWQAEPNYRQVAELALQHCDFFVRPRGLPPMFDRRFLLIPQEYIEVESREQVGERVVVTHCIRTPRGDLRTKDEHEPGISTGWYTEPLLKDKDDVERLLSVPFYFDEPDLSACRDQCEKVGDRGLTEIGVSTPMVCVSRLFEFGQFLEWCASERAIIERLVATAAERIAVKLRYVLECGLGPVFWFGGSEQATPPMMSPRFYDDLVVRYDGPLMDLVHEHGQYVHVHCHGKVREALDKLIAMGADLLDPVEPPPDGDIQFWEAKERARGKMVLIGNIEFRHLEFATPQQIDAKVQEAIERGGKQGMILGLSATAITRISDRYRDNAIQYIESGLRYGTRN